LMLVRSLDSLLGQEEHNSHDDGMLEREFRLIFNCLYLQILFCKHNEGFIRSLELGQGRLGKSLVALLFEAAKMCADTDRIPIKKVVLLLLQVLQCLLDVPDYVLCPSLDPEPCVPEVPEKHLMVRDFQAFAALHLHAWSMQQRYRSCGCPAAIQEGLSIIEGQQYDFLTNYAFHPSEVSFMQTCGWMQEAYERYEELQRRGLTASRRPIEDRKKPLKLRRNVEEASCRNEKSEGCDAGGRSGDMDGPCALNADASCSDSDTSASGWSTAASQESTAVNDDCWSGASVSTVINCAEEHSDDGRDLGALPQSQTPTGGGGARDATVHKQQECSLSNGSAVGASRRERDSSAAVFQRLYLAIFPRLTETVVLLLRLLLTSCSNVENYPGVVDMARERHATKIADEAGLDQHPLLMAYERNVPTDAAEAQRHREIMAAAVGGVIFILLKQARKSVPEQFSSLAQLITDSNGALVVLKFLNQDLSSAMEPRDATPVLPCLWSVATGADGAPVLPSWPACATLRLVEVLYLLCKDSPERVRKYLIHYKAPFILKRLRHIENWQVQRVVLKLLRKQVRYLPRKWKQANMKAISAIYSLVPMSPLEDWLLNEPLGDVAIEGPSQADIRASNVVYNASLLRHLSSNAGLGLGTAPPAAQTAGEVTLEASSGIASGGPVDGQAPQQAASAVAMAGSSSASSAVEQQQQQQHPLPVAGAWVPQPVTGAVDVEIPRMHVLSGEALGYSHLFPQFVPACCL